MALLCASEEFEAFGEPGTLLLLVRLGIGALFWNAPSLSANEGILGSSSSSTLELDDSP